MPKYRLGKKIAQGGFGEVYEAIRLEDGSDCAIKKLLTSAGPADRLRFDREVRLQATLRHENIVPILGTRLDEDPPWFVMPRAAHSLREHLHGIPSSESLLWVFFAVASAIRYAHQNNVLHRDLKPENILFFLKTDGTYSVAVADFGVGRFLTRDTPTITQANIPMGTIQYMAPEQVTNARDADERADVFALGKILYEILSREVPYPGFHWDKVPPKFHYVIQKACSEDPDDRYQSVPELVNDVITLTEQQSYLTRPEDQLRIEIQWMFEHGVYPRDRVTKVVRLLSENTDDNIVMKDVLPALPDQLLFELLKRHEPAMQTILQTFDREVSGALAFAFCDVVADFYARVFGFTESPGLRLMIIRRLPRLGSRHNRYHVAQVFSRLVLALPEQDSLLLAVRDSLAADPDAVELCRPYFKAHSLPPAISAFFRNPLRGSVA